MAKIYYAVVNLLPKNLLERHNAIVTFLMGALPAAAGSAISFLLNIVILWALVSVAFGRFRFQLTPSSRIVTIAALIYGSSVLLTIGTGIRNHYPDLFSVLWLFPFLFMWILPSRFMADDSARIDYLTIFCLGASVGAVAGCLVGLIQMTYGITRWEGGTFNAGLFGAISLMLGCFSALNITHTNRTVRYLAFLGLLAGMAGMLGSQTRGVWLTSVAAVIIVFAYARSDWRKLFVKRRSPVLWLPILLVAGVAIFSFGIRSEITSLELKSIFFEDNLETSIGERFRLWFASIPAIIQSPILGYGVQDRMLPLQFNYWTPAAGFAHFTHAHNMIITALLDGGILVTTALLGLLAAPVLAAREHGIAGRKHLFFAMLLCVNYVLNGMTQITFKHDIMDSFFIYAALIAALPPNKSGAGPANAVRSRAS